MNRSGQNLSHYRVGERLGAGGMAEVYSATDTRLDRTVALKILPQSLMPDSASRQRFLHEARSASSLHHPNICTIFAFEETADGVALISMELVEGETLRERMLHGPVSLQEALRIAVQCARGLSAAHARSIIHRDIKPSNIMISRSGEVKLLDFGLAKRATSISDAEQTRTQHNLTEVGITLGTVAYMSPEQARGDALDVRTDLFSIGIVFYQLVSGAHPFEKRTSTSTVASILTQPPPPLNQGNARVPEALERIIGRCLEKRPQDRYASAADLLLDLEEFQRESSAPGTSSRVWTGPQERVIPRRVGRGLLVLLQLAYLLMYGAALWYYPSIQQRFDGKITISVLALAVIGVTLRLYLISSVQFDDPETGRQFRRLFPFLFLIDTLWACSPLLLFHWLGLRILFFIPFLAYLPFSQRTLVRNAYSWD